MRARVFLVRGFTLIELVVVVGIITILAALLLPVLDRAKGHAKRTSCLNNLKQINLGVHMYADDQGDCVAAPPGFDTSVDVWFRYQELVKGYVGLSGPSSRAQKLFACPADSFFYSASGYHSTGLCESPRTGYSSYIFNAGNLVGTNTAEGGAFPGISGKRLGGVREPSKTVLVCEDAAFTPFSWHHPQKQSSDYRFKDSRDLLSFVDGHVSYVAMYWSGAGEAWQYDPPASYNYRWSDK